MKKIIQKYLSITLVFSLMVGQLIPGVVLAEEITTVDPTPTPVVTKAPAKPAEPKQPQAPQKSILEIQAEEEAAKLAEELAAQQNSATPTPSISEVKPEDTTSTGGISTSGQIGDTTIDTGDATTTGTINNNANTNVSTSPTSSGSETSVENSGNGEGSSNTGSATTSTDTLTEQANSAIVSNELEQASITGNNEASRNTGGNASITTGDANTTGTIVNAVNTNIAGVQVHEFNIFDDQVGDIILDTTGSNCILGCSGTGSSSAVNENNGSESTNSAEIVGENSTTTTQTNDAVVTNDMVLVADTGNNTANSNTGGDTNITTGDANVVANILNFINTNIAGNVVVNTFNIFGELVGDIIIPESNSGKNGTITENSGNGTGSTNVASTSLDTESSTFQSNIADIDNNLVIDANTGGNTTASNTGGDNSITTGSVNVDANILNVANSNIAGGDWWITLVNNAGTWMGKIMGAPEGATFAATQGTGYEIDENGYITASKNSDNGGWSHNTASTSQSSSDSITQNNNATLENNIYIDANTGNNSVSRNTGGDSSVTTGDVNVIADIVNFVNLNIASGDTLYLNLVNILDGGSWFGNLYTPEHPKEEIAKNTDSQESENTSDDDSDNRGGTQAMKSKKTESHNESEVVVATTGTGTTEIESNARFVSTVQTVPEEETEARVAGISDSAEDVAQVASDNALRINLAWLILIVPFLLLLIAIKKTVKRFAYSR